MDSLNSDGPGALALEPLCQGAAQELLMRSYTIRTVNRYKRVWKQLADGAAVRTAHATLKLRLSNGRSWAHEFSASSPDEFRDGWHGGAAECAAQANAALVARV